LEKMNTIETAAATASETVARLAQKYGLDQDNNAHHDSEYYLLMTDLGEKPGQDVIDELKAAVTAANNPMLSFYEDAGCAGLEISALGE
jgi:hypothetical protein